MLRSRARFQPNIGAGEPHKTSDGPKIVVFESSYGSNSDCHDCSCPAAWFGGSPGNRDGMRGGRAAAERIRETLSSQRLVLAQIGRRQLRNNRCVMVSDAAAPAPPASH